MRDLFHIAAPIRDAAVAETLRALGPDAEPCSRDGGVLGAHLVAVLMAWGSERHNITHGAIKGTDLMEALAYGVGLFLGNVGLSYRPTLNGVAAMPRQSVNYLLQRVAPAAMDLALKVEQGCADISLPIERQEDGTLGPKAFDLLSMLAGDKM